MSDTSSRPLSPHLQIYRPLITMIVSIVHRITGFALYVGTIFLAWWLVAAASGAEYFEFVNGIYGSIIGRLGLFIYTWILMQHLLGGLRHLYWDTGRGLDAPARDQIAWATVIGAGGLTVIIWIIGYLAR